MQIGLWRYGTTWSTFLSVTEFMRNFKFDHPSLADQLHAFGPTFDDTIQWKREGLALTIGTVEDGLVVQPSFVMYFD